MTERSKLIDGKCAKCGCLDMMLTRDQVKYTPYECVDGVWMDSGSSSEDMDNVRFFCTNCGEYHEVPEELL